MTGLPTSEHDVHLWWETVADVAPGQERGSSVAARRTQAWAACSSVVRAYEPLGRVTRVPRAAPVVTGVELDLSFAYAGSSVLIAVSQHRSIGIDAESSSARVDETLIRHALTARELEELELLSPPARRGAFLRAWVRKEAVLKAAGVGLLVEPAGVETGVGPLRLEPVVVPAIGLFRVVDLAIPGLVGAVAVGGAAPVHARWCVAPPLLEEAGRARRGASCERNARRAPRRRPTARSAGDLLSRGRKDLPPELAGALDDEGRERFRPPTRGAALSTSFRGIDGSVRVRWEASTSSRAP